MEIFLDAVDTIACEELDDPDFNADGLETVVVDGGTLTLKSSSSVRFVNIGFTVLTGAHLVFDMPTTNFGPNTEHRTGYTGITVKVEEYASATFVGRWWQRRFPTLPLSSGMLAPSSSRKKCSSRTAVTCSKIILES
ncbi:unnamed protein product [Laminaria digitata]